MADIGGTTRPMRRGECSERQWNCQPHDQLYVTSGPTVQADPQYLAEVEAAAP